MSPIFSALAAAATAIGTAAGATGAVATAIGAGVLGAGTGMLASDITQLVNGNLPWKDPGEWFGSAAKAGGLGALGGAVGSAIGPALGAAGDALGLGSNAGTVAAEAGAPSGALDITGNIAKEASDIMSAGATPTDAGISQVLEKAATSAAAPSTVQKLATGVTQGAFGGAASGAVSNPENPLMGAATGAASGVATGLFRAGASAAFSGMDNGFWSPQPKPEVNFKLQTPGPQDYSLLRTPQVGPQASMSMSTPQPQLGGRVLGGAANIGGNLSGRAASQMVGTAMTPTPPQPMQNPYAQWGQTPYWMKPGFR